MVVILLGDLQVLRQGDSCPPCKGRRKLYSLLTRETEIKVAARHVRDGARNISRQHKIVPHLSDLGAPIKQPRELLGLFEQLQVVHIEHLRRLQTSSDLPGK